MLAMVSNPKRDSMDATTDIASKLSATTISNSARRTPASLTTLPTPILHKILTPLLDTELVNAFLPPVTYTASLQPQTTHLTFTPSRSPFPISTALFHVNKSISTSALTFFHAHNLLVKLDLYTSSARHAKTLLLDSGLLFFTAGVDALDRCQRHAMDVKIVEAGSKERRASVVFPAQYLPRLVNFMREAGSVGAGWGARHEVSIEVRSGYGMERARVQGDLLEGFRSLSGISRVEIKGEVLGGYARGLERGMMGETLSGETWMAGVRDMLACAEREGGGVSDDDDDDGEQYLKAAVISLTFGYLTQAEMLHGGDEAFAKDVQRMRWRAELGLARRLNERVANTATTHIPSGPSTSPSPTAAQTARSLLQAETAASSALSLATDSPSPASNPWVRSLPTEVVPPNRAEWFADQERGEAWLVLGLVHMALSEFLFAAGDLERAVGLLGEGKTRVEAQNAFARARESIDWEIRPGSGLRRAARVARRGTT